MSVFSFATTSSLFSATLSLTAMTSSMTTATEAPSYQHRIIFPRMRTGVAHPNPVLFIPEIMLEIGTYLQKEELWASSLVCVAWHKVFSPFLDWKALNHSEDFLQETRCITCYYDSTKHRCKERWRYLDNILGRIGAPDAALGFHSARNPYLSNRIIEYNGPWVNPTGRERYNPRLDRLYIMIVEKSTLLEKLRLHPRDYSDGHCYRWSSQLELASALHPKTSGTSSSSLNSRLGDEVPPSSGLLRYRRSPTPRWPRLVKVGLTGCRVDHSFLRVLLSNAPALEELCLYEVTFSQAEVRQDKTMMDCSMIQGSITGDEVEKDRLPSGIISENCTSAIKKLWISRTVGQSWKDAFLFASQLPRLVDLLLDMTEIQHEKAPSFTSGFHCLGHLVLYRFSGDITAFIVRSIPAGLFDLRLFHVQLDRSLVQGLTPTHSHTLRYVCLSECTQVEEDHVVHLILSTLHGLEFLDVFRQPVICDPEVLQRTPWVCRNLQELYFIPKCDGSSRYSPLEAQQALMTQIGALTNLRKLYFGRLYSADYKNIMETGFAPEASWTLLSSLTKLKEVDLGFLPEVPLTARDARMMVRYWPRLEKIYSVDPKGNEAFVDYMKVNRPKIQLRRGPRY